MKKAFDVYIKPANDRLGRLIASPFGFKRISVEQEGFAQMIPVYVTVHGPNGLMTVPSDRLRSIDALGLSVRSKI